MRGENAQVPGPATLDQRQAGPVIREMTIRVIVMARLLAMAGRRIKGKSPCLKFWPFAPPFLGKWRKALNIMTSAKPKTSRPAIELIADSDCVIERFVVKPQRIRKLVDLGNSTDEIYGVVAPPRTLDRRKKRRTPDVRRVRSRTAAGTHLGDGGPGFRLHRESHPLDPRFLS
ncbi:hypothetical protein [Oricola sp.]|uniref:hypothetical protein n=1 Tax=Oricola sp. TaxID=1979950 RepID=UPI003BAADAF7